MRASILLLPLAAASLAAQPVRKDLPAPADPARVAADPTVKRALDAMRATNAWTLEQQVSICEIPAPPFKEAARAAELKRRFESLGLVNVRVDREGNVWGERPGSGAGPTVHPHGAPRHGVPRGHRRPREARLDRGARRFASPRPASATTVAGSP